MCAIYPPKAGLSRLWATVVATIFFLFTSTISAQEFKLALSSSPRSMDPHFWNIFSNRNVLDHLFETLITMDADSRIVPGLAESWALVNHQTWEFKLRKGVRFHDGSELTAEDVVWSINRPATNKASPIKLDANLKAITNLKIIDPYTIRFITREPHPLLLPDLTTVYIVSKKATQGVSDDDFANGKGMVGTGRFKFVKFLRDDRIELERNDAYWGVKSAWSKVTLRFIPNGATRMAALLTGDVQAIENVPTPDLERVRANSGLSLYSKVSYILIFLYLDTKRDKSPFITDKNGKPLDRNPLRDVRVRQAMSMAIDRQAIKEHVMEGLSEPTNNLVPPMLFGHNPHLQPVKYDLQGARKLLAQAGYPNGFGMTLHTSNNRYVNGAQIAQTIAQMLTRVGIVTKVDAMPISVNVARGLKREFSFGLIGWGALTGEASSPLRALLACENPERGLGVANLSMYCNPTMDALLLEALNTVDDMARLKLLQDATAIAINDVGIIPVHHQVTTWAAKKGFIYTPRTDERTHAYEFRLQ